MDSILVLIYYIQNEDAQIRATIKHRVPVLGRILDHMKQHRHDDARRIFVEHHNRYSDFLDLNNEIKMLQNFLLCQNWPAAT